MSGGQTQVVHVRRAEYDVYVGRAGRGLPGYFGNPIKLGESCLVCGEIHEKRGSIVDCFERWARDRLQVDLTYRERVRALHGKRLGCFCAPRRCHGDVLKILAAELNDESPERLDWRRD